MRVISSLSQRLSHSANKFSLPPHDLSPAPSLSFSSLHFKSSSECQRPCGSAVVAAFLCLSLSHSSCSHSLPASAALTLYLLSLFLPPLLAVLHSFASLFSTPLPILGKSLLATNFSACRSNKERDYGLICWLRVCSVSRQVAALFSLLLFPTLNAIRHLKPLMYAWHRVCVCVVDAVYIG